MKNIKILALTAVAAAAGIFTLTRPPALCPTDLKDAVRDTGFNTALPDFADGQGAAIIPKASAEMKPATPRVNTDASMVKWKLTFEDNFATPSQAIASGTSPACFTRAPLCVITAWGGAKPCPQYSQQLANLNKCVWRAYDFYNYMDFDAPRGEGINAFNPAEISVQNGQLTLTARRSAYRPEEFNCKNPMQDPVFGTTDNTKICPFISGGIDSMPDNGVGFDQQYGRFEVLGKLSHGPGTWPAFWLLPSKSGDQGGWPYSGEIDIMEAWSDHPNEMSAALHEGVPGGEETGKTFQYKNSTLTSSFHLYAVEWDPGKVTYMVDNKVIGTVYKTDSEIPSLSFYWVLNLTIERGLGGRKKKPDVNAFTPQQLVVDYVRVYRKCEPQDNPEECLSINVAGITEQYNTYRNETAFAQINVYPSPQKKGTPITARVTATQYCQDFQVDVVDMAGRRVTEVYKGPWESGETKYFSIDTSDIAAAIYLLRAEYKECQGGTKGNHVFKFMISN